MSNKTICLIPARGGSKRVKNKNIKKLYGKPLIQRIIENAKNSKRFKEIYVSTDSIKIKKLALKFGAKVPFIRSKKLSNDRATIKDVINDFIKRVIKDKREKINIFVLYPTSIFANKNVIQKSIKMLKNVEYVTAVKKFPHPIDRALEFKNKKLMPVNLKKKMMRTQDLKCYYYNSGQLDLFKLHAWIKKKIYYKMKVNFLVLNELDSKDIDNPQDFKLASKLFYLKSKKII